MNLFRNLMLTAISLSTMSLFAADPVKLSSDEVKAVQKKLSSNRDLHVNFYRTKKNMRGRETKSRGEAWFSQPNKFHWTIKDPLPEEFIFNGSEAIQYQEAEKFAIKCKTSEGMGRGLDKIVGFVLNFESLLEFYLIKTAEKVAGNKIRIELEPRNPGQIKRVELMISMQLNYVSELTLHYEQKRFTKFSFVKPRFKKIPDSIYSTALPKGVRVRKCM